MPVLISPSLAAATYMPSLLSNLGEQTGISCSLSSSAAEFLQTVKTFCYVGQCNIGGIESSAKLTLVVDGRDTSVVKSLLYFLQNPQTVSRPRVLLMSSVQTWAGCKKGSGPVSSVTPESFWARLPVTGEYDLYCTENQFATLFLHDKLMGFELCIIPIGLVYGGAGGDLAAEFDSLWRFDKSTLAAGEPVLRLRSLVNGSNKIPLVHHAALGSTLAALCVASSVPLFLPAAGADSLCLASLFQTVFTQLNGEMEGGAHIAYSTELEIIEDILNSCSAYPNTLVWSSDVNFSSDCTASFSSSLGPGIVSGLQGLWAEYLNVRNLRPISIFIAGSPGSGKTELAKGICTAVGTRYVDAPSAIKHVVRAAVVDNVDPELKKTLYNALEAEMQKTKAPPKKGEADVPIVINPDTFELTDALQSALDKGLIRRCLAAFVRQDSVCCRRGYVMDTWGAALVASWAELLEATTGKPCEDVSVRQGPELVVELQSTVESQVSRLLASLGIAEGTLAKAPKDQQAAVKSLEEKLNIYAAQMKDIPLDAGVEGEAAKPLSSASADITKSHGAVLDMEASAKVSTSSQVSAIFRFSTSNRSSKESVRSAVCAQLLAVHGPIGWLSDNEVHLLAAELSEAVSGELANASNATEASVVNSVVETKNIEPSTAAISTAVKKSAQERSQERIQNALDECKGEQRALFVEKTNQMQNYLLQHVMPELAQGMVQIALQRPHDPISFLANHLYALAAQKEAIAEKKALDKFNKLLAIAEGRWIEPEAQDEGSADGAASVAEEASVGDSLEAASVTEE